jgi:hypothetical protein
MKSVLNVLRNAGLQSKILSKSINIKITLSVSLAYIYHVSLIKLKCQGYEVHYQFPKTYTKCARMVSVKKHAFFFYPLNQIWL